MATLAYIKKTLVAALGVLALLVSNGVLSGNVLIVANAILSIGTVLGVYQARNKPSAIPLPPPTQYVPPAPPAP